MFAGDVTTKKKKKRRKQRNEKKKEGRKKKKNRIRIEQQGGGGGAYMIAGIMAADARPYPTWAWTRFGMLAVLLLLDMAAGRRGGLPFSTSGRSLRRRRCWSHLSNRSAA